MDGSDKNEANDDVVVDEKQGGTLALALTGEPDTLDPQKSESGNAAGIQRTLYESLVYIDSDRLPKGWLAESWVVSDDQRVITFALRDGVEFHDGTPLNAQAVEFTFSRLLDPEFDSPSSGQLGPLLAVAALDERTVEFVLEEPYAPFWTNLSHASAGIISPTAVGKYGDEFGRHPVGSGPFIFESWTEGTDVRVVRNPDYRGVRNDIANTGPAHLDGVIFRILPESDARIAALEQGDLHLAQLDRSLAPRFLDDPAFKVEMIKEADNIIFVEFSYGRAPFDDPGFRRAVGYAIDRQALLAQVFGGYGTVNSNPLPVGLVGWDPVIGEQSGTNHDPEKAKTELAALGWTDSDGDGVLDKDGLPAAFRFLTYSREWASQAAGMIQAQLQAVGLDVTLDILAPSALMEEMPKGEFGFDLMKWSWHDPSLLSKLFKSPGWKDLLNDPELDALLIAADQEMNPEIRLEKIAAAQRHILENGIIIPLLTEWEMIGMSGDLQGFHLDALGSYKSTLADAWLEKP